MANSALVVGGTGPTGPHVLRGLLRRGFDVSAFHRGSHEPPDLPEVRHIHGDPHFAETIRTALGRREYNVVLAAYGRTALLAEAFRGRAGHFLAIGGAPRYAGFNDPQRLSPAGAPIPLREDAPSALTIPAMNSPALRFAHQMVHTEEAVFAAHPDATYFVYPIVYGPRTVWPWEWSVVKRIRDGRGRLLIPDEGLAIHSRVAARNAAEVVLRSIDRPQVAKGQRYNVGDDVQYSIRQWVELLVERLGVAAEIVSVPSAVAPWVRAMYVPTSVSLGDNNLLDTAKARRELGYRDVIDARAAVDELLAWFGDNPVDPARSPSFVDFFDYALEDALLESWAQVARQLRAAHGRDLPADVHPMPHPKSAGELADQKGR